MRIRRNMRMKRKMLRDGEEENQDDGDTVEDKRLGKLTSLNHISTFDGIDLEREGRKRRSDKTRRG